MNRSPIICAPVSISIALNNISPIIINTNKLKRVKKSCFLHLQDIFFKKIYTFYLYHLDKTVFYLQVKTQSGFSDRNKGVNRRVACDSIIQK
jgi:hypothetical protein